MAAPLAPLEVMADVEPVDRRDGEVDPPASLEDRVASAVSRSLEAALAPLMGLLSSRPTGHATGAGLETPPLDGTQGAAVPAASQPPGLCY